MHLDEASQTPYYQQIYQHFHEGIEAGTYPAGGKLPSIRGLASELHCSRNTVEAAYQMLVEEGYVASKPGSGYVIQEITFMEIGVSDFRIIRNSEAVQPNTQAAVRYDFTYGNLQAGTFPALTWRSITDDILASVESRPIDTYTNPLGERELREEIAWRLSMTRSVHCKADQIVLNCGTQPSVNDLLALFDPDTDSIAIEEPGYDAVRNVIERHRFRIHYCNVLYELGDFVEEIERCNPKLVYVTPSSQFPTTRVMGIEMRQRIIEWARCNDAYILEDDYCREFRYHDRALPPLHSMDPDRVIYMGTFSKSISPALRINYLVLPPKLLEKWKRVYAEAYPPVPWLSQAVLTRFLKDGHRDRHLRKQQTRNKRKYDELVSALHAYMGDKVDILENGTGLHVLVNVPGGRCQKELIEQALEHDVRVYDTNRYWKSEDHPLRGCVLVGFSAIPEEDIVPGVKALAQAWFGEK